MDVTCPGGPDTEVQANCFDDTVNSTLLQLLSTLRPLIESLQSCNVDVEPDFVHLGDSLQSTFRESTSLAVGTTEAAKSVGNDSEESMLNTIVSLAHESHSALENNRSIILHCLTDVEQITKSLGSLRPQSESLIKIAMQLRAVSICFAIESSRSDDIDKRFVDFTNELKQLANQILDIARDIQESSHTTEVKQLATQKHMSQDTRQICDLADKANQLVSNSIEQVDEIVRLLLSFLDKVAQHSKTISQHVSSIVIAIQFRDITRQQVEHIIAALQDAEHICLAAESDTNVTSGHSNVLAQVHHLLRLQSIQLGEVIRTIKSTRIDIETSFEAIRTESQKLELSLAQLAPAKIEQSYYSDAFAGLGSALRDLANVFDKSSSLSLEASNAAEAASEVSTLLTRCANQIDSINVGLKMKALNAIVKSARLEAKGQTLSILAQEVMTLSASCNDHVTSISDCLSQITQLTSDLHEKGRKNDAQSTAATLTRFESSIDRISDYRIKLNNSSSAASYKAADLQKTILLTEKSLIFIDEMVADLTDHLQIITDLASSLAVWTDGTDLQEAEIVEQQCSRYTMHSERMIHQQAIELSKTADELISLEEAPSTTSESSDFEDLGDNVELF